MADIALTASAVLGSNVSTATGTAGETIAVGQAVYLKTSDGKLYKALAAGTAEEARVVGIALGGGAAGQTIVYATRGEITSQSSTYSAKGNTVLLAGTAGGLHVPDDDGPPASTEHLSLIGFASETNKLLLMIVPNIMTI